MQLRKVFAACLLFAAASLSAQGTALTVNRGRPVFTNEIPFTLTGTAAPNTVVTITLDPAMDTQPLTAAAGPDGTWSVLWTAPLRTGTYDVKASGGGASDTQILRVQLRGTIARQPQIEEEPRYRSAESFDTSENVEVTDRWRIAPPPYEIDELSRGRKIGKMGGSLDPYNKNLFKGDYPIYKKDTFFVFTGISDSLFEERSVPTPSGPAARRPTSFPFFGSPDQGIFNENLIVSGDLYQGLTTFQPVRQRIKATVIANYNHVSLGEVGLVKPDVRRGNTRDTARFSLQEAFYERRLLDLSPNFDFLSVRVGSQPFSSDFRGFILSDTNVGIRLFGNYANNRFQYNLAAFDRLEKDTNSGLNRNFKFRGQRVGVANVYWQDFLGFRGYTQQFSVHRVSDHPPQELEFDMNGGLVRPAPIGSFTPHEVDATYFGESGLGHIGKFNIDQAIYYVFGKDSENPIAGPDPELRRGNDIKVRAGMAAIEVSYDRDWYRPRFAIFYASGDDKPRDRTGRGFDAIFDAPAFAGGGFSFFNRLGIRLTGTGVALVDRGSLLTSLRSSKDEGQPNFVNPGVQLASIGLDVDVTPRLKAVFTGNYIRLDKTQSIEEVLFQGNIGKDLGADISLGLKYRPVLSNNWIVVGGVAGFFPGSGWKAIYEKDDPLYHVFTNIILEF